MLTPRCTAVRLAGLASLGAGVIHAVVVPDHAAVWWISGAFFAALAVFQVVWGMVVALRPDWSTRGRTGALLVASGVVVNLGSAVLWATTRWVTGEPFGPQAGTPLPVGPAGIASTGLEIALLVGLLAAARLPAARRRSTSGRGLVVALLAGASLLVAPTAWGVTGALAHDHSAHADDDHHGDDTETHHDDGGDGPHGEAPVETTPETAQPSAEVSPAVDDEEQTPAPAKKRTEDAAPADDHHDDGDDGHDH